MATGFCCVAGLREPSHEHIRPVLGDRLPTSLLAPAGGPFDMGAIVEFARAAPIGRFPEVEDHLFRDGEATRLGYVSPGRLWSLLRETAQTSLEETFGPMLTRVGERAFVAKGLGQASLGCLRPDGPVDLVLAEREGHSRLRVDLRGERLDLSLTDARFYLPDDYAAIDLRRVRQVREALRAGEEVLLGVGLTRAFTPDPAEPERHWLQVNAIHMREFAGWRLNK